MEFVDAKFKILLCPSNWADRLNSEEMVSFTIKLFWRKLRIYRLWKKLRKLPRHQGIILLFLFTTTPINQYDFERPEVFWLLQGEDSMRMAYRSKITTKILVQITIWITSEWGLIKSWSRVFRVVRAIFMWFSAVGFATTPLARFPTDGYNRIFRGSNCFRREVRSFWGVSILNSPFCMSHCLLLEHLSFILFSIGVPYS